MRVNERERHIGRRLVLEGRIFNDTIEQCLENSSFDKLVDHCVHALHQWGFSWGDREKS